MRLYPSVGDSVHLGTLLRAVRSFRPRGAMVLLAAYLVLAGWDWGLTQYWVVAGYVDEANPVLNALLAWDATGAMVLKGLCSLAVIAFAVREPEPLRSAMLLAGVCWYALLVGSWFYVLWPAVWSGYSFLPDLTLTYRTWM